MVQGLHPIEGEWYEDMERGRIFQVIELNKEDETVNIQYEDGELDEIGYEDWYEMDLENAEPPEDWTEVYDDIEKDDLGYTET